MSSLTVPPTRARVPLVDLRAMHDEFRDELDAVWGEIVDGSDFVGGAAVEEFETGWAAACNRAHAIGVANGTDALTLALRALGVRSGDEVIVPANTFVATAEGVLSAGATPRFVDVDPATHLLTPATVEPAIGPRTRAIIVVHLHGHVADMGALLALANERGLLLVEDAAQAHGASWHDRPAGSFGIASCFSFYPGKNLGAMGDAGAIVTDDQDLAERIRSLANHGRDPGSANVHPVIGVNSRLDGIQAAVLMAKLPRLEAWNDRRRAGAAMYDVLLAPVRDRVVPLAPPGNTTSAYHHYVIRIAERDRVREELSAHGIETGIHYPIPCHRQAGYRSFSPGPLPVSELLATEIVSLPLFPHITADEIDRVCEAVSWAVAGGSDVRR